MKVLRPDEVYSNIAQVYCPQRKRVVKRWVLSLPGAGCSWAKKSGGCYMCGFKFATHKYSRNKLLPPFVFEALFKSAWLSIRKERPQELWIYNGGSFLNNQEIPPEIQQSVCTWVAKSDLNRLLIESRPEYITPKKVALLLADVRKKALMIGIGLECEDDVIRETCINKGITKGEYEKAVNVAKSEGAEVLTYVFLKPINLSENASIKEAVNTIRYAFAVGSDLVALESAIVQKGTVMAKLYEQGNYRPPWLWSVIEVVKKTRKFGPVYVGEFEDTPPPIATPFNCSRCSKKVRDLLQRYRETYNVHLFDSLDCECKEKWYQELQEQSLIEI